MLKLRSERRGFRDESLRDARWRTKAKETVCQHLKAPVPTGTVRITKLTASQAKTKLLLRVLEERLGPPSIGVTADDVRRRRVNVRVRRRRHDRPAARNKKGLSSPRSGPASPPCQRQHRDGVPAPRSVQFDAVGPDGFKLDPVERDVVAGDFHPISPESNVSAAISASVENSSAPNRAPASAPRVSIASATKVTDSFG